MPACKEFEDRLIDEEDAQAAEHLRGCPACAAEAAALSEAVQAVALPSPSAVERAVASQLGASTWSAWKRAELRSASWRRWSTIGSVAAAAALLLMLPVIRERLPGTTFSPPAWDVASEADGLDPVELTGVAFGDDGASGWTDEAPDDSPAQDDGVEP